MGPLAGPILPTEGRAVASEEGELCVALENSAKI